MSDLRCVSEAIAWEVMMHTHEAVANWAYSLSDEFRHLQYFSEVDSGVDRNPGNLSLWCLN